MRGVVGLPPRSRGWILLMQKHPLVHSFKTPTEETHTWGNPTEQQMQPQPSNVTSTNVWHRRQGKPHTSHPARPRPKQTLPAFSRKIVTVVVGPNRQQVLNLNSSHLRPEHCSALHSETVPWYPPCLPPAAIESAACPGNTRWA